MLPPTIVNDRTLVPVRFITESLGGAVEWNGAAATATLDCDGNIIDVPIGKDKIIVNGEEKSLDVGAQLISDRTMLPLRAIGEALGKEVEYDEGFISLSDTDVENYDENYDDYDRGIIYKRNLDTGEEIVLEPDIKVSTRFEEIVKSDILKEEK